MKKSKLMIYAAVLASIAALSVSALETAPTEKTKEAKSVAWYVANIQEAKAQNKVCYGNGASTDTQSSPDCLNSLQALKISHVGNN